MCGLVLALVANRRASRAIAGHRAFIRHATPDGAALDTRALRDLAVVRYDALQEMTGRLSFSLALLNSDGDGVVISSINSRTETRTYAKVIQRGKGVQPLSPEETRAVQSARLGHGPPVVYGEDVPSSAAPGEESIRVLPDQATA